MMNMRGHKNSSSQYKGVSWHTKELIWISRITFNRKEIYIGRFKDEIEAAKAYDEKAKELFGKFAYLNIQD